MAEPNWLLRAARERTPSRRVPGSYMSREELADAVALWAADHDDKHREVAFDANHLGKLERGTVRCPRQPYLSALCALLHATPAELGFRSVPRLMSAEPEREPSDSVEGEFTEPESAASAPGSIAGEVISLHHQDFVKYRVTFPALGFDELRHIRAAFNNARRYFDAEVVGYFKKQLNNWAANDGSHGPVRALPSMLGIVAAIEFHAREVKANVRRELLTVGAQAAEFVGWLYRDAGQLHLSGQWRDRATEWAQEAGDWPMQGYLLLKKSQAAWDERDGIRMLTLAQAAHDGPWQLPLPVQAEIAQQEARGLAMIGESRATVDAKLNEAWEIFTATEATMRGWGAHYDRALLTMQTAICYCESGRPRQAVQLYREHLDDEQIPRRDRGYFLSLMAGASAHAAEPDNAASAGYEALAIAVETHSQRTIHELKRVCALLEPWYAQPVVYELREAVFLLSSN